MSVNTDGSEGNAACIQYNESHDIPFPTLSGSEGNGSSIGSTYGITALPTYILIAPDHSIVVNDIWPVPGVQTFISAFEGQGIMEASCEETLTASFTADETEICVFHEINFSDASTGGATEWNWTFEGGDPESSDEQNPTVTYNTPGTYNVELEVSNGSETNSVTMEDYIIVNTCTGIEEPVSEKLSIYPNPTNGVFDLAMNYNGDISIKIVNMLGVTVYNEELNTTGEFTKSIDLNGVENGVYIISIQTVEKTYVEKLRLHN